MKKVIQLFILIALSLNSFGNFTIPDFFGSKETTETDFLVLKKQSAVPSQANTDTAKIFVNNDGKPVYIDDQNNVNSLGGSGNGDSDTIYYQDFESKKPSEYYTVSSGTCNVVDNIGTPISGKQSFQLVVASGNQGCRITSPAVALELEARGVPLGFIPKVTYSGNDKDIKIIIYQSTDGTQFNELTSYYINKSTHVAIDPFRFEFDSNATHWKHEIFISTETVAATLGLDKIKLVTDPFNYSDSLTVQSSKFEGAFNTNISSTPKLTPKGQSYQAMKFLSLSNSGGGCYEIDNSGNYSIFNVVNNCVFDVNVFLESASQYDFGQVIVNDTESYGGAMASGNGNWNIPVTVPLELKAGDSFYISYRGHNSSSTNNHVSVVASKISRNIVFKDNKKNKFQSYTPVIQGMASFSGANVLYKRDGNVLVVKASFDAGTVNGNEFRFGLPLGLTVSDSFTEFQIVGDFGRGAGTGSKNKMIIAKGGNTYVNISNQVTGAENPIGGSSVVASNEGVSLEFRVEVNEWDHVNINAVSLSGGQNGVLVNACMPNALTDGTEFFDCREIDHKKVYGKKFKVTTDISAQGEIFDPGAGLDVVDTVSVTPNIYIISSGYQLQLNNHAYFTYNKTTGKINVVISGETIRAGTIVTIYYTK